MKGDKALALTFAGQCKNILASNSQGRLHTIKADAKGSKDDIYASKVKFIYKKGKPYLWVPEKDLHNVNAIIDERGSFAVASPLPGTLAKLLSSMKKLPARVALTGDVVRLVDEKVQLATKMLQDIINAEQKTISESSYSVSGILGSSNLGCAFRSENLQELLAEGERYIIYKFNPRSCLFVDGNGEKHEVELREIEASKADLLSPFSAKLIDGINQSEVRRRALMLFCLVYQNKHAKDALMLSMDRKGFEILGKIPNSSTKDGVCGYQWKELRFALKDEARDVETFCNQLVQMEEDALAKVSSFSGL